MQSLISPVAWLPLSSGMFYRRRRLAPSPNPGSNSAYNEKDYGYVPMLNQARRRGKDRSRGSSALPKPDSTKRDHFAAGHGRQVTRSGAKAGRKIEVGMQGWATKDVAKRSSVPRVLRGADLYVVRRTKTGLGCAQPCWRCVGWCRWAGIKRIFHWDSAEGQFKCVKVCDDAEHYRTQADSRRLIERARLG